MKKIIAFLLALTMALTLSACGKSKDPAGSDGKVPDGAVTDETKLGESVTYSMDGEDLLLRIRTSADFDAKRARIAGTDSWTTGILPWIGGIFRAEYSLFRQRRNMAYGNL